MYTANTTRYDSMVYNRCGYSGLKLPEVSLGLWHNFGDTGVYENMKKMVLTAFDHGITHFDLANNYGPEPGSAESNFGKIMKEELSPYRDEILVSTKAGYGMWDGPLRGLGQQKISAGEPGPEFRAPGPGLCGYFLSSPYGSGDAFRRDDGRSRAGGEKREGALRGRVQL